MFFCIFVHRTNEVEPTNPVPFKFLGDEGYNAQFRVPVSVDGSIGTKIVVKSSTGNWGSSAPALAFNDDLSNHWESGSKKPANFTVTFAAPITFQRVIYANRLQLSKGFPTEFRFFGKSTADSDLELIYTGAFTKRVKDTIDIRLDKEYTLAEFVFSFDVVVEEFASMSVLAFYKRDDFLHKIEGLFEDGTWSELSSTFKDNTNYQNLKGLWENHVLKPHYEHYFAVAEEIRKDTTGAIKSSVQELECVGGDQWKSRVQTAQNFHRITPTGYYWPLYTEAKVYCENYNNPKNPSFLLMKLTDRNNDDWNTYTLQTGYNVINYTKFIADSMYSGGYYLCQGNNSADQFPQTPKCRVTGGKPLMRFVKGQTTTNAQFEQFLDKLDAYAEQATQVYSEVLNGKDPNVIELYSPHNLVFTTATAAARQFRDDYVNNSKTTNDVLQFWEELFHHYSKYMGLEDNPADYRNLDFNPTLISKVNLPTWSKKPYAWSDWTFTYYSCYCDYDGKNQTDGFAKDMVSWKSLRNGGWGYYHEWGHNYDIGTMKIGETTNNLFSLLMERNYGTNSRLFRENRYLALWEKMNGQPISEGDGWNVFNVLAILRGIEIYFDHINPTPTTDPNDSDRFENKYGLYGKIRRSLRTGYFKQSDYKDLTEEERWPIVTTLLTGYDCRLHFEKFGIGNKAAIDQVFDKMFIQDRNWTLKQLPKTYYVSERSYLYKLQNGNGMPADQKPFLKFYSLINGVLVFKIGITNFVSNEFEHIAGYEITDLKKSGQFASYHVQDWVTLLNVDPNEFSIKITPIDLTVQDCKASVVVKGFYHQSNNLEDLIKDRSKWKAKTYPPGYGFKREREGDDKITSAYDGDLSRCMFGENYNNSVTDYERGIEFDLNETHTIYGFLFNNNRGNDWGRVQKFQIYCSNDSVTWTPIIDPDLPNSTLPDPKSQYSRRIYFQKPITASYIRFTQTGLDFNRGNHLSICDFNLIIQPSFVVVAKTVDPTDPELPADPIDPFPPADNQVGNVSPLTNTPTPTNVGLIVGVIIGVLAVVAIIVVIVAFLVRKRKLTGDNDDDDDAKGTVEF